MACKFHSFNDLSKSRNPLIWWILINQYFYCWIVLLILSLRHLCLFQATKISSCGVFFPRNFIVSDCMFISVTHFQLFIVFDISWRCVFFFLANGFSSCSRPFFGKIIFSLLTCFCALVKNHLTMYVCIYFWTLLFHFIRFYVFLAVSHCLDYCSFLGVWLLQLYYSF